MVRTKAKKRKRVYLHHKDDNGWITVDTLRTHTVLTESLMKKVCALLRQGNPISIAAPLVGFPVKFHYRWIQKGKIYEQALEDTDKKLIKGFEIFYIYLIEVERAHAEFLSSTVKGVTGHFKVSWVRDMTVLERRDPGNWGRTATLNNKDGNIEPDEEFL